MGWGCFDREPWITSRSHSAPSSHLSRPTCSAPSVKTLEFERKQTERANPAQSRGESRDIGPRITHTCVNGASGAKPASVKHTWGSISESHPWGASLKIQVPIPVFSEDPRFSSPGWERRWGGSARPRGSFGSRCGRVPGASRAAIPLILPRPCPGLGTPRLQPQPTFRGFCTGGKSRRCKAPTSAHRQERSLPGQPGTERPRPGKGGLLEPGEVPSSCSGPPKVPLVVLLGLYWMIPRVSSNLGDSVISQSPTPSL